jgi:hypothetical protein
VGSVTDMETYTRVVRIAEAKILKQQENFQPLPKPMFDIETLFYISLPAFDAIIQYLDVQDLCSLLIVLDLPQDICWYCMKYKTGFAKEYFSYLSALPPTEDEYLIKVFNYCWDNSKPIIPQKALMYPRSEKMLQILNEKRVLEGLLNFESIRLAITNQVLPRNIVETLWKTVELSHKPSLLKHQIIYDSILLDAAKYIAQNYPRHTLKDIIAYGTQDRQLFKYPLREMPATAEFIKFLQSACFKPYETTYEIELFKFVCNHLELTEELTPLFQCNFLNLGEIVNTYGRNYQDTDLSLNLLRKKHRAISLVNRILASREWDAKQLYDICDFQSGYIQLRKKKWYFARDSEDRFWTVFKIVEKQWKTRTELGDWEMFIEPFAEQIPLEMHMTETMMNANFYKTHPKLWSIVNPRSNQTLDMIDELGENHHCWRIIRTKDVFRYPGAINWQWVSKHKHMWTKKSLKKYVPFILYYKYLV